METNLLNIKMSQYGVVINSTAKTFLNVFSILILGLSLVGCKEEREVASAAGKSRSNLPNCTNNAVTTGACKIDTAGYAVTDEVADLIPANIVNNVTLFGVLGIATGPYSACTDNGLNASACSTAAGRYVTSASGSNVTTWTNSTNSTTVEGSITTGFYNSKACQFTDADLVAANIKSGINIFGVPGALTPAAAACTDNALNASACTTAASRYVTSTSGSDVTTWTNSTNSTTVEGSITTGFYDTKACQFTDADLVAANIKSGVNIFGVPGTLTAAAAACTDDGFNASVCSTAASRYVTATSGSNVTTWTNGTGSTTVEGSITTGFYNSKACQFTDADLVAANIKSNVEIFGVTGTYSSSFAGSMSSMMHRAKGFASITLSSESSAGAYTNSSSGYRAVPDITKDDDGGTGGNVTYVDRTGWSTTTCGTSQSTVNARIADCATVFGANATWDGDAKGNAGQGVWKLVTRTGAVTSSKGREVWRDERTKLLWSSLVSTSQTWCKATGSNNITNNPTAQDDPHDICDNSSYQATGTGPATKAVSACFEDGDNYFTTTDGLNDNAGKAGLGLASTPSVAWRVPSIYDFQQANINGIRFVLPDLASGTNYEWSSTTYSPGRSDAWAFISGNGHFANDWRQYYRRVRCVGH